MLRSINSMPFRYFGLFSFCLMLFVSAIAWQINVSHAEGNPVKRLADAPIMNLYQMTPRLYSGGQPKGEEAFLTLEKLGVKTIISVDGARPDITAAHAHGMRYVHLPIGYDEVPEAQGLLIAKAMKDLEGPLYVHCHHGKHRGPAAAAVGAMATEGWNNRDAVLWLKTVGTSDDYPGLYESVASFVQPADGVYAGLPDQFPEISEVSPMAEIMARIDRHWDNLKDSKKQDFLKPSPLSKHSTAQEALQLQEYFHELLRQEDIEREGGRKFVRYMQQAEDATIVLRRELLELEKNPEPVQRQRALDAFSEVKASCKQCHIRYRNT
jgi:protein tyrosine phosphatase (PTP) superfamily phosphohydrolase (DUF442 family)